MMDKPKSAPAPRRWRHPWLPALGAALGLVSVSYLLWFIFHGKTLLTASRKDAPAPAAQTQPAARPAPGALPSPPPAAKAAPAPAPGLKSELAQVLAGIREANRNRDLSQFLSYYSPSFPQLTQRAQSIFKTWKTYNYPDMEFDIQEIKPLSGNKVTARVIWRVEAQTISTMKRQNISRTYLVTFTKEAGQWRISALDKAD